MEPLPVGSRLILPPEEIELRTMRASGPGGQRVNKVETCVELRFDVRASKALGPARQELVEKALAARLVGGRILVVRAQAHRERVRNLEEARDRLASLLAGALKPKKARRATKPTRGSKKRRLSAKRRQGERKRGRQKPSRED